MRDEHQRQGAATVTVRNIITSMRLISDVDWTELFERISLVDDVLAASECGFPDMDFSTRNLYRSAIEELARGSNRTEIDIARSAVLARQSKRRWRANAGGKPPGRSGLSSYRRRSPRIRGGDRLSAAPCDTWPGRLSRALGIGGYVGAIAIVAAVILALPLFASARAGLDWAWLSLLGVWGAIPAIDAAVALVNRGVTRGFGATLLPALDLRDGVPPHLRTLVAVPTLLTTLEAIEEQIERLEIHHLASPEGDLHFALLSDWVDAATETREDDAALLAAAAEGIAQLNQRHGPAPGGARFLLLHRRRVWNESEGAVDRLGAQARQAARAEPAACAARPTRLSSTPNGGRVMLPADVRYVITLDADTRLPRDTVRRLIGKMAHPLNRPRFDADAGRVVEGYAVLQPRVTPSLPVGQRGLAVPARLLQHERHRPLCRRRVRRVPGSVRRRLLYRQGHLRCRRLRGRARRPCSGFDAAQPRSVRGRVRARRSRLRRRGGRGVSRPLRRRRPAPPSLGARRLAAAALDLGSRPARRARRGRSAPSRRSAAGRCSTICDVRCRRRRPSSPCWPDGPCRSKRRSFGLSSSLATIVLPTLIPVVGAVVPRHAGITLRSHLRALGADLRLALTLSRAADHLSCASGVADGRRDRANPGPAVRHPPASARMGSGGAGNDRSAAAIFSVSIAGWPARSSSPFWRWSSHCFGAMGRGRWRCRSRRSGSPRRRSRAGRADRRWSRGRLRVSDADARALRLIARRTWRFFETFVTPADHMLPPDNFQEDPAPVLAHRTSPTNIGLYLLSVVSARDFGWTGTLDAVERLEATLRP